MATFKVEYPERNVVIATWSGLKVSDPTGEPNGAARYRDRSVQVFGTFGLSGTVVIEGSNDKVNWVTLRDSNESPLSFTGPDLAVILEPTMWIRPRVTAGDANTNLTVVVMGVDR